MVKCLKGETGRNPLQIGKERFEAVGLTRCDILKRISKCGKSRPHLKCVHCQKRLKWAKNNMKVNFDNFYSRMNAGQLPIVRIVGIELV